MSAGNDVPGNSALFRSEEMALHQLFLQSEAAYTCIGEVGEVGLVQFRDMNPEVNAFQRKFVNEVRRCDELERKIRFVEKELKKEMQMRTAADEHSVPEPGQMTELEGKIGQLERELRELMVNQETLQKNFLELTELKEVLIRTQDFFTEAESGRKFGASGVPGSSDPEAEGLLASAEQEETGGAGSSKLGVVAGVITRDRLGAFERVLWRVCRGNVFMKHTDIEQPLKDPSTGDELLKSVFIVFFQGEQLGSRVKKICEGFRATMYPCPEQAGERREMLTGVESRIADLRTVLDQTLSHRTRVLEQAAMDLPRWMVLVKKIKAIYHTLNLFQVSQKYLQAQCWIPVADIPRIQQALDRGTQTAGSSVPSVLTRIPTNEQPPTFNRTNKFTDGFQNIIDAYGVSSYREVNPMPFTCITFPFLFAVMFGDTGHGIIMTMFAALLILKERQIIAAKSSSEIFLMFFGGRYVILLMGIFSVYTGLIYNDIFSKSINVFGSQWEVNNQIAKPSDLDGGAEASIQLNPTETFGGNSPYPFGFDPIWQVAENKLLFLNSFKMKLSVVLGVSHMLFGIVLSLFNHTYFEKRLNVIADFIPQILFMSSLFGYLVFMILYKWLFFGAAQSGTAPNLLTTLIDMFMAFGSPPQLQLYPGQTLVQTILVVIAAVCVPWMLLLKPLVLYMQHRDPRARYGTLQGMSLKDMKDPDSDVSGSRGLIENDELAATQGETVISSDPVTHTSNGGPAIAPAGGEEHEEFDFAEVMILQAIHTIEFCLGCISHTASYLRLWALSLAHAELSEVLWSMIFRIGLAWRGYVGAVVIVPIFAFWAVLTLAILLLMEGLSAFLHALRLHWVEFNSKFYHGDGHLFAPFTFAHIVDSPFEDGGPPPRGGA